MTEAKFKGIVKLQSKEQFEQLKTNGSIVVDGKTIIYSPTDTQYVYYDGTVLHSTDILILNGGNSNVGG